MPYNQFFENKMFKILFIVAFISLLSFTTQSVYDENFARYKLWPMCASANSPNPELCIHDTFKNASVGF